jgi:pimeloyl-ACP methyl ester carboxylesterase
MKARVAALVGVALMAACSGATAQTLACAARSSDEGTRIDEAGFVVLGGIEQWVTIRSRDRSKPVLLHVHGGPGFTFSPLAAEFAADEADYTVVQWDQRGSGCTFGRHGQATPEVTIERIARDGIELAEHLQRRLSSPEIVAIGHSFGSLVAIEMVRRAPDHFAAYVGTGQFVRFTGNPASQGPAVDAAYLQGLMSRLPAVMTPKELADWQAGRGASVAWLLPQVQGTDLLATVDRIDVPFLVIQGAEDATTPTAAAAEFFEHVEAPAKQRFVIEGAGHFPHFTHTEQFLAALRRHVP